MSSLEEMQAERKGYEETLEEVLNGLNEKPDNQELITLRDEIQSMIQILDDSIAEIKAVTSAPRATFTTTPTATPTDNKKEEKWSRENHPAFKKANDSEVATTTTGQDEPQQQIISYNVNDTVMAKWLSGDKGFYPARITSITGSSTNPVYTVKFKSYDEVETLRAKDIRPVATKRKADGSAVVAGPTATTTAESVTTGGGFKKTFSPRGGISPGGVVAQAAAEKYTPAQQAAKLGGVDDEKPKPKFKKIKANKELEAGKNKWQEFNAKGKFGKAAKKESMFRTPEGVKGRVGFTGSGQAMRKDVTRTRHVYQPANEDDD
ncbi:hypothetical protein B0H66DRAFT_293318 [Apodospora peruviana]|uniref:Tudor domain-containing protein n=1 Tax=Apodospora peruviana TaxID=516989 RepID=A0AAE0M2I0_9PEZI|nr:hypothetical protein B0H66DRAFT_293318 [Apodospora peruviana]